MGGDGDRSLRQDKLASQVSPCGIRRDRKLFLMHSSVRGETSTTRAMSRSSSRMESRVSISSAQVVPGILSVAWNSPLRGVEVIPSCELPASLRDGWEAGSPPFKRLTSSRSAFISWRISFIASVNDDASASWSKPVFDIITKGLLKMQQPCMWRAKKKVEYTVVCTVFMGGRCACALAHVYLKIIFLSATKSCGIKKLGQTPLICETEPSEI